MDAPNDVELCRLPLGEMSETTVHWMKFCLHVDNGDRLITEEAYDGRSAKTKNSSASVSAESALTLK